MTSVPDQEALLRGFAAAAEAAYGELTALDRHSGDGDYGDNLRHGTRQALAVYDARGGAPVAVLGEAFLDEVGGTSGPLLGLLFTEIAHALEDGPDGWASGAEAGLAAIQRVGEARIGDRTMIDALTPAVEALRAGGPAPFAAAAAAARDGAAGTAALRARMGRASYVGDRVKGEPDPGAVGVALLFWSLARAADEDAEPPLDSVK
ncbi:DAK2 domain-containing protein [Actinomadura flavalba]|uniref:DAK2 domain-containing protein n=1 Tax=Actinomadura flavalba TaxID=1120938 RepID=UPI00037E0BBC|nr:DAK2 domain-containing protein [Actinomadura flavalba]